MIPNEPTPIEELITVITDPITIHPTPIKIDTFTINGANAQPKYILPLEPTDLGPTTPPGVNFAWSVSGGSTVKTELLLPSPITVETSGSVFFPVTPGERRTITLQVTDTSGNMLSRSVEVEAVDPTPTSPEDIAAAAATAAVKAMQDDSPVIPPSGESDLNAPRSINPTQVSPTEQPPRWSH